MERSETSKRNTKRLLVVIAATFALLAVFIMGARAGTLERRSRTNCEFITHGW